MKKTYKIVAILIAVFLAVGCGCTDNRAKDKVRDYLDNYKKLDDNVSTQLDKLIDEEDLKDKQKDKYKDILKRQYQDMKYEITDEVYNGDEAKVTAKITVYDYYKVQQDTAKYLSEHKDEFYTDGAYDEDLYIDYKLDEMKKYETTVTYSIDFTVVKENGKWVLEEPTNADIQKIHGIYDYSNDTSIDTDKKS